MAVSDGDLITVMKDMGLVTTVFDERKLSGLRGHLAIGHTRYSTAGSGDWRSAQPVFRAVGASGCALSHNGNLTNTDALVELLGALPGMGLTDSDLLAEVIARAYDVQLSHGGSLREALFETLPLVEGAFSLTILDGSHIWVTNFTGNSVTELKASDGSSNGSVAATCNAASASPAWKSQGAASSARLRTRSGRRCAAATASVPPRQYPASTTVPPATATDAVNARSSRPAM